MINMLNIRVGEIVSTKPVNFTESCARYSRMADLGLFESLLDGKTLIRNYELAIGRYEWLQGDCNSAKQVWVRASDSGFESVLLFYLGWMAENGGDHQGAVAYWKSAQAGSYFVRKAESFRKTGDMVAVKRQLLLASEIDPSSYEMWKGLGEVYAWFGEMDKSAEAWHQGMQTVPVSSPNYWWARASAAQRQGNVDEALRAFEYGANIFGGDWSRRFLESAAEMLQGEGDLEEARQMYLRVIRVAPHWIYPYLYIAQIENSLGHPGLAGEWYAKAVDIDPTNAEACDYLRALSERIDDSRILLAAQKCVLR